MIILGIDPGTATTGYGVIETKSQKSPASTRLGEAGKMKNNLECLGYGLIKTEPTLSPGERLKKLNNELTQLLKKYRPEILAVENIYFFKNLKTAMPVSQAKGVILLTAAKKNIPVREISPLQMKLAITGYGKAEKEQVKKMIKILLNLDEPPKSDDAADALGVAICCSLGLDRRF